ncbi:hypothetical protein BH20VER1_BH20VER1_20110 [soil metagenome]
MKPISKFNEHSRRVDREISRAGAVLPKIDQHFQGSLENFAGRCRHGDEGSFRSISKRYFAIDARRSFAVETAVFGLIVMIVAVPVVQSAAAFLGLLQALWIS